MVPVRVSDGVGAGADVVSAVGLSHVGLSLSCRFVSVTVSVRRRCWRCLLSVPVYFLAVVGIVVRVRVRVGVVVVVLLLV